MSSQGFFLSCLMLKEIRFLSTSTSITTASTASPILNSCEGCLIFSVHEISEIWTRPWIPSSNSTKAPYFWIATILPVILLPTLYLPWTWLHGSDVNCFIPRDTLFLSLLMLKILTLISSPTWYNSDGCPIFPQDISVIWTRPSIPPRSTNMP